MEKVIITDGVKWGLRLDFISDKTTVAKPGVVITDGTKTVCKPFLPRYMGTLSSIKRG